MGHLGALHAEARGLPLRPQSCVLCAPGVYNQQIRFRGAGLFLLNQDLLLFKYVENNENGFNNWDDFFFLPQLPPKRCVEPTKNGQIRNKWGPVQDQAAGQLVPSQNLASPLRPPACSPRVTQAEELSIKAGPDSTSTKQTRHQPPNC